eukprot:gnl/Chilomastix_cuspidata/2630.p1 GENE.gnl/Chilomastix_cuspidata/2630~~gnl/Chilomastix_cuspidata/2630.p1  ORF type:complete len:434 (+),score=182.22 gnl/Chilomastix_cuspidata/2630:70-1371(+)
MSLQRVYERVRSLTDKHDTITSSLEGKKIIIMKQRRKTNEFLASFSKSGNLFHFQGFHYNAFIKMSEIPRTLKFRIPELFPRPKRTVGAQKLTRKHIDSHARPTLEQLKKDVEAFPPKTNGDVPVCQLRKHWLSINFGAGPFGVHNGPLCFMTFWDRRPQERPDYDEFVAELLRMWREAPNARIEDVGHDDATGGRTDLPVILRAVQKLPPWSDGTVPSVTYSPGVLCVLVGFVSVTIVQSRGELLLFEDDTRVKAATVRDVVKHLKRLWLYFAPEEDEHSLSDAHSFDDACGYMLETTARRGAVDDELVLAALKAIARLNARGRGGAPPRLLEAKGGSRLAALLADASHLQSMVLKKFQGTRMFPAVRLNTVSHDEVYISFNEPSLEIFFNVTIRTHEYRLDINWETVATASSLKGFQPLLDAHASQIRKRL